MWDLLHHEKSPETSLSVYEAKSNFVVGQRAELGKQLFNMSMIKLVMNLPWNYETITKYLCHEKSIFALDSNITSIEMLEALKMDEQKKTRKVSSLVHRIEYHFPKTLMSGREFVTISTLKKEKTSNGEDCYIFYLKSFDKIMTDALLDSHSIKKTKKMEKGVLQAGIIVTKVYEQQSRVCIFVNVNIGGKYTKHFQPLLRSYLMKNAPQLYNSLIKELSQPNLMEHLQDEEALRTLGFWETCKENS